MKSQYKGAPKNYYCAPSKGFNAFDYLDHERERRNVNPGNYYSERQEKGEIHYGMKKKSVTGTSIDWQKSFNELAFKWRLETGLFSTTVQKVNDTYLEIIAKGEKYLPYILQDLAKTGSPSWHIALKAITGEDPIVHDEIIKPKSIKEAWLKWANDNFLI